MHPLTIQSSHAMRAMAVAASMLAAYAAFSLVERIQRTDNFWSRRLWLTSGATVLGLGMWSMHFFGALEDPVPSEAVYSLRLVVLCLLVAISSAYAGFRLIIWRPDSPARMVFGAAVLGIGAWAMHLVGNRALTSTVIIAVRPVWALVALVTSCLICLLAVWLAFGENQSPVREEWMRLGGSTVMGSGVAVIHILVLHALVLEPLPAFLKPQGNVRGSGVGEAALLITIALVLLVTFGTAAIDKRRFRELSHLHAQLAASEQALLRSEGQLREANALLSELSIRDSLTGLYNRRRFDEVLDTEWRRALRTLRPLAFLMIDVASFKSLNDSYGPPRGDECLREIARVLEAQPRRGHDIVARFGGEEFAVLLPGADVPGALRIAHNIRQGVEDLRMEHRESRVSTWVTVSVGVCSRTPRIGDSPADMVYEADMALYLAKQLGRNRVELRDSMEVEA